MQYVITIQFTYILSVPLNTFQLKREGFLYYILKREIPLQKTFFFPYLCIPHHVIAYKDFTLELFRFRLQKKKDEEEENITHKEGKSTKQKESNNEKTSCSINFHNCVYTWLLFALITSYFFNFILFSISFSLMMKSSLKLSHFHNHTTNTL